MYAADKHKLQPFGLVLKDRSLTCVIAKCPVLSEQFTELGFTAFQMIGHLSRYVT